MTVSLATDILKETLPENVRHHDKPGYLWSFLREYCIFYISKHFISYLRQGYAKTKAFDGDTLYQIIERSLYYVMDGTKDLEQILQFTAETWTNKDIFAILKKTQLKFEQCMAFDFQMVP
mmetsp:Transcript_6125/g.5529  ORF Transcript_6125/g.5529 Transcript_6125/m.5529 type:complete len:120 (+) Transcript_6125:305-664(+)